MKMVVITEDNSKVVDDKNVVLFTGSRVECLDFIADKIEENMEKVKNG